MLLSINGQNPQPRLIGKAVEILKTMPAGEERRSLEELATYIVNRNI